MKASCCSWKTTDMRQEGRSGKGLSRIQRSRVDIPQMQFKSQGVQSLDATYRLALPAKRAGISASLWRKSCVAGVKGREALIGFDPKPQPHLREYEAR